MTTFMQHMSTTQAGLLSRRGEQTTGSSLWNVSVLSLSERISRAAFTLIVLAVLTIATVCVVDAVRLVGQLFPGFMVTEQLMASNFGRPDWSGPQNGIKSPDRLREADGTTLSSIGDLEEVVRRTPVGQTIRYVLERDGQQMEIAIPTMRFTWMDLGLTFGPTFSAGLLYLVIAIVVYVLKPDTPVTWALVLSCFLLGTYQILTFDVGSTHRFVRATLTVYAILPGAGLHLSLMFPERKKLIERWKFIQFAPYVVSVV